MVHLGIDIGTTSLAVAVIADEPPLVLAARSEPHGAGSQTLVTDGFECRLDLAIVQARLAGLVAGVLAQLGHPAIDSIGITGQMHGFAFVDDQGSAVASAWTWQDTTVMGNAFNGHTWLEAYVSACGGLAAFAHTGTHPSAGYAGPMVFRLLQKGLMPADARVLPIPDALGAWLIGTIPAVGRSTAASFGLLDLEIGDWDAHLLQDADLEGLLPPVAECTLVGRVQQERLPELAGVPVICALGDNQASFLGSVADVGGTVLVNVGTGAQLSCAMRGADFTVHELRPYWGNYFLQVQASLSGGTSFEVLRRFYADILTNFGFAPPEDMLEQMWQLAEKVPNDANGLEMEPLFAGEREVPSLRGQLTGISSINLTAANLSRALVEGLAQHLADMLQTLRSRSQKSLVGAGNALARNALLRESLARCTRLPLTMAPFDEAAAVGAALYGLATTRAWDLLQTAHWLEAAKCR